MFFRPTLPLLSLLLRSLRDAPTSKLLACLVWYLVSQSPVLRAADGLADRQAAVANSAVADKDEEQTLAFIREHQPKLLKLLKFLEKHQPALYTQALKEMSRSQQRLESLAKRDVDLYAIELKLWQVRSELRLLAAELAVASNESKERSQEGLVKLIQQESACERERLQLLKSRAEQEVLRLSEQIDSLNADPDEYVARQVKVWQNRIQKQSRQ